MGVTVAVGGVLSVIDINCVFDVILLEESSACHITAVWPEGKI